MGPSAGAGLVTDWNTQPREAVARAAAAGDPGAQLALRLHESLDRAGAELAALRAELEQHYTRIEQVLAELTRAIHPGTD